MTGALRKAAVPLILALFLVLPGAAAPARPRRASGTAQSVAHHDRYAAGGPRRSPLLQELYNAQHGPVGVAQRRFTRAFAHTPMTLPSHTNILLGTTPSFHGVHDNADFMVRGEFLTLAEHLQARHYATGAFVGASRWTRTSASTRGSRSTTTPSASGEASTTRPPILGSGRPGGLEGGPKMAAGAEDALVPLDPFL